jgi:hypothetical protein
MLCLPIATHHPSRRSLAPAGDTAPALRLLTLIAGGRWQGALAHRIIASR